MSFPELLEERKEAGYVQPSVQRGDGRLVQSARKRKLQEIDVEMDDIEFLAAFTQLLQHQQVLKNGILRLFAQPQCGFAPRHEFSSRRGIARSKQRNIMALADEFFSKI